MKNKIKRPTFPKSRIEYHNSLSNGIRKPVLREGTTYIDYVEGKNTSLRTVIIVVAILLVGIIIAALLLKV